jgi:hypothetical protein
MFRAGFIGRTVDGRTTTLGRNGSDYTATLLGAALKVIHALFKAAQDIAFVVCRLFLITGVQGCDQH